MEPQATDGRRSSGKVEVFLRLRPLSDAEVGDGDVDSVVVDS